MERRSSRWTVAVGAIVMVLAAHPASAGYEAQAGYARKAFVSIVDGSSRARVTIFERDGVADAGPTPAPARNATAEACVSIRTPLGSDSGCGAVAASIDPLLASGTASGTIQGRATTISLDLTWTRTSEPTIWGLPLSQFDIDPEGSSVLLAAAFVNLFAEASVSGRVETSGGTSFQAEDALGGLAADHGGSLLTQYP